MLFQWIFLVFFIEQLTADRDYYFRSSLRGPCPLPRLENGRVRVRQKARLVKFMCQQRYELVGNKYATCVDGQWDVPIPVCLRPGCTVPRIENGVQMINNGGGMVIYFCLPGFKLSGSPVIYCDGRRWNASAPVCVDSTALSPLSCDFEDLGLCGWMQDELHDFDWKRLNTKTPSSIVFTGPSFDHTLGRNRSGYFMYIESTSRLENDTARFISPVYARDLSKDGCFSFFYHMYGQTCGGLRVYQKPDNLTMQDLLKMSDLEKKKYMLFEKWGNLGDYWYGSVSQLRDLEDNFQIIIEGIRGSSFTSDIAIDDVAILQGDNCTAARNSVTTSATIIFPDSCAKRCMMPEPPGLDCYCSMDCLSDENCCPDFFETCIFVADTTIPDDMLPSNRSSEHAPQTQKLVATTPETTSTSTTSSTTTTTTTTTTTPKPTTVTTTTTSKPTSAPTTRRTTTSKPITTRKATTIAQTTRRITTRKQPIQTTRSKPMTTKAVIKTTTPRPTTKAVLKTRKVAVSTTPSATTEIIPSTVNAPYGISRTIENHNVYHEMVEKAKKEHNVESRILEHTGEDPRQKKSSGWKVVLVIASIGACLAGVAWVAMALRSSRGRITIARFRGRVNNDPEVRYLSTDVDDD